jgi:uncharacterized protein (TIGR00304 family)
VDYGLTLFIVGLTLIFTGIILVLVGFLAEASKGEGRVEGGGVVVIGPIPIVFGSNWKIALILVVATIILMLIIYLLFYYPVGVHRGAWV